MTAEIPIPSLANLETLPYLNDQGYLPQELQGKIGVYAILNPDQKLQLVNFSRDIYLSLKQHLVRQPHQCYSLKVYMIERPNRTVLETIRNAWISENGSVPPGNAQNAVQWLEPIDVKSAMTPEEQASYQAGDELMQIKLLKTVARRVESEIKTELEKRGVQEEIRFNPKLKEQGLLDLK